MEHTPVATAVAAAAASPASTEPAELATRPEELAELSAIVEASCRSPMSAPMAAHPECSGSGEAAADGRLDAGQLDAVLGRAQREAFETAYLAAFPGVLVSRPALFQARGDTYEDAVVHAAWTMWRLSALETAARLAGRWQGRATLLTPREWQMQAMREALAHPPESPEWRARHAEATRYQALASRIEALEERLAWGVHCINAQLRHLKPPGLPHEAMVDPTDLVQAALDEIDRLLGLLDQQPQQPQG